MAVLPSGEQWEFAHGDLRAVAVEVGGGLRVMSASDVTVLDGYRADEMCHDGRGQVLMPWPNRLRDGSYVFAGEEAQLPLTEVSHDNAIHGLVRWATWRLKGRTESSVHLAHRLHPVPGYPFLLDLEAEYTLSGGGLAVTLRAANTGTRACPFGAGQHPYVRAGVGTVDGALLRIPARSIYRYDNRLIPTQRVPVDGTPLDFQQTRPIGDTVINMDYTDLQRDDDGLARVTLQNPAGPRLEVWMDDAFKHVTVYTGETVQPPARRRQSVAVEPMTCPPNAFQSGQDLITLEPGQHWEGRWGITVQR